MAKYLCVQRSLPGGAGEKPSVDEMKEMYARFGAWQEKYKGRLGCGGSKAHGSPRRPTVYSCLEWATRLQAPLAALCRDLGMLGYRKKSPSAT